MKIAISKLEARIGAAAQAQAAEIRERIQRTREAFSTAMALWHKQAKERSEGVSDRWKETRRAYRLRLKQARQEWRCLMRACKQLTDAKNCTG
jgi:hypothetical protein